MDQMKPLSPPEVVQIVSIYNCLNALSDYLFINNYLSEDNQFKQIPVVNSLSECFEFDYCDIHVKNKLMQAILKHTDLYGEMPSEIIDENYIMALINHIIEIFVFEEYGNVQGFLTNIVRTTKLTSTHKIYSEASILLRELAFENEYGPNSCLTNTSINYILQNIIKPHFAQPEKDHNIFSIEYIYAQSGLAFVQSLQFIDMDTYEENVNDNKNETHSDILYQRHIGIAIAIEHAVSVKELDEGALNIFSFSAFCYYVFIDDEFVSHFNTTDIVMDPYHWSIAYNDLFDYIKAVFDQVKKSQEQDYKQQFYLSLFEYKSYATLAADIMNEHNCLSITNDKIENYQKNHDNNYCKNKHEKQIKLPDLNEAFYEENLNIKIKHYNFENKSIHEAFGEAFINRINTQEVIIYKVLGINTSSTDDFLMFRYSNDIFEYYILKRDEFELKIYSRSKQPELFTVRLIYFENTNPPTLVLKNKNENFNVFADAIASKRSTELFIHLDPPKTHQIQENDNFWAEFALSLIPFYSCAQEIADRSFPISCIIDTVFLIPGFGTLAGIGMKTMIASTRALLYSVGLTLRTVSLRLSFQATLKITARTLGRQFSGIFTKQMFQKVGKELLRIVDPGLELLYILSKSGMKTMKMLFNILEMKGIISFDSIKQLLTRSTEMPAIILKSVNQLYHKGSIYVNSFSLSNSFSPGYKYIKLTDKSLTASLRSVPGSSGKKPVIKIANNEYSIINTLTGETYGPQLILEHNILQPKIVDPTSAFVKHDKYFLPDRKVKNYDAQVRQEMKILEKYDATEMQKEAILQELRKYNFPKQGDEAANFVKELLYNKNLDVPSWSKNFKIDEPEIFFHLKYDKFVDKAIVIQSKLEKRINSIYSTIQMTAIENFLKLNNLIEIYDEFSAYILARFEDYLAVKIFLMGGYQNMTKNTDMTRRMKNALYRLAIRQLDDSDENFTEILYTWEIRPGYLWEQISSFTGLEYKFKRFVLASKAIPPNFFFADNDSRKILYRMEFKGKYLRAAMAELHFHGKFDTVLFPGIKFEIINIRNVTSSLYGPYNEVNLEYVYDSGEMLKSQQNIMRKIKELGESKTVFYYNDE